MLSIGWRHWQILHWQICSLGYNGFDFFGQKWSLPEIDVKLDAMTHL
jgi:hypothetical protein